MSFASFRRIGDAVLRTARSPGLGFIPIALTIFILADFGLGAWMRVRIRSGPFRFPESSIALVEDVLEAIANQPSPYAVFLGDSVVRGVNAPADKTIVARLESLVREKTGKPWRIFNLGLTAANNSDKLILLKRLFDTGARPDLVIVEDNIKFYSRQYPVQTARYPDLVTREQWATDPDFFSRILELNRMKRDALFTKPEELAISLSRHSFLIRNREWIASLLGGGDHPVRRGLVAWNRLRRALTLTPTAHAAVSEYTLSYDLPAQNLDVASGVNMRAIAEIARLCGKHGQTSLSYLTALNIESGRRGGFLNDETLNRYRVAVGQALGDARYADLLNALPESAFRDMDHPTDEGMDALARELAALIIPIIAEDRP